MIKIVVRGSNDIGSAVAHRLFQAGYAVVLHDIPAPAATRRKMAFTDAVFDGQALLEGVSAVRVDDLTQVGNLLVAHAVIPLVVQDFSSLLESLHPQVLVDARMRKHQQPEPQRGLAPLTIGLGPNFVAGETVDLAVETGWGEALGRVVWQGATTPLQGEPREIGGHGRERYVYAPQAGTFHTAYQVGDMVAAGEPVAQIDGVPLLSPLAGAIRGLTHDGVPVQARAKVIEIDPRGATAQVSGIAERPGRIAAGVLEAVRGWR